MCAGPFLPISPPSYAHTTIIFYTEDNSNVEKIDTTSKNNQFRSFIDYLLVRTFPDAYQSTNIGEINQL